jgi:predicted ArsR family transcriptional regulator
MRDTLTKRALQALGQRGHATFDSLAHELREPPRKVRWTLDNLRRNGHVKVSGSVVAVGRGRPKVLFSLPNRFALQGIW